MRPDLFEQLHQHLRENDVEAALRLLRDGGLSKIQSIKSLTDTGRFGLAEAKLLVHESVTWRDVRQRDSDFQEALDAEIKNSWDEAEDAYAQAAAVHGAATDPGDYKKANAAYERQMCALARLRESPDQGRSSLTKLLEHDDPHVRCWAATHLLPLDEEETTRALEALASEPPFVGFNAKMVLREWKAGRLKVP